MVTDTYKPYLFEIGLESQHDLNTCQHNSEALRKAFNANQCGIHLSKQFSIGIQTKDSGWVITDHRSRKVYTLRKKSDKIVVYDNLHVVNQIVDRDLCVRCGACEPACPVDIIRFHETGYPYLTDEALCVTTCTRCLKVCPGEFVDFGKLDQEMFGAHPHPDSITGIAKRALVSFATDATTRSGGASGGFVTQILVYMLNKQLIDGALVLGVSTEQGGWKQEPFIARTVEDVKRAAKSKYLVVPYLRPLKEMEEIEGNYAVVALPCYIHALRKYQRVSKKLRDRIKLVIGLFCGVAFEPHLVDEVCRFNGIPNDAVADFQFRYGEWPGGIVAQLKNGETQRALKFEEWKDGFNSLKLFYMAPRCNMCIDFSAEYADLAVGDPWLRGPDGKYLFEDGRTTVLVRTEVGDQIVRRAVADGYIDTKEIPLKTYMMNFEKSARYKRDFVPKHLWLRKLLRQSVPNYGRGIGYGKTSGFIPMLLKTAILSMARFQWFRRLGLTLAQTPPALAYLRWNRRRKESKFAALYPQLEHFVDRLRPIDIDSHGQAPSNTGKHQP